MSSPTSAKGIENKEMANKAWVNKKEEGGKKKEGERVRKGHEGNGCKYALTTRI